MAYLPPDDKRRRTALVKMETPQRAVTVQQGNWHVTQTTLNKAARIRNPVSAWLYKVGANARVSALTNAERIGRAAEKAAEAEAAAADALLRRADKLSELTFRQVSEPDAQNNRFAEQRHKIDMDQLRRQTEAIEAHRRLLDAKHALEATKKFKPKKFELGQARFEARIADSQVDAAVARAAGSPSPAASQTNPAVEVTRSLNSLIEQRLADGKETAQLQAFLSELDKILGTARGGRKESES